MAARAFIERVEGKGLRAVCRETGLVGAFVPEVGDEGQAERQALAMLSDACDCDDYHSVMEDTMTEPTEKAGS